MIAISYFPLFLTDAQSLIYTPLRLTPTLKYCKLIKRAKALNRCGSRNGKKLL